MFKISIKTKIIIFIAASVVAILTLINAGMQNRNEHPSDKISKPQTVEITSADTEKNAALIKPEEKKITKDTTKQEEDKKEENKALEDRYNEGYKAFFAHRYEEAINIEDEVLKKDNNFYKAYNLKGIALSYSGKYEEGMKNIDKALQLSPDFGYAIFNKALTYELYGHYDEAIKWYNKDLKIEKYVWSYYGIASIYGRKGDVENVLKYLKEAAAIDSGVKALAKDEADFNPVKNSAEFQSFVNN